MFRFTIHALYIIHYKKIKFPFLTPHSSVDLIREFGNKLIRQLIINDIIEKENFIWDFPNDGNSKFFSVLTNRNEKDVYHSKGITKIIRNNYLQLRWTH